MSNYCDVVVDLQSGDTGKGKVTHSLLSGGEYDLVLRYNGGSNAGHTIYHKGKKIVTHQVPAGVLYGIKSLIGVGCVVNIAKLEEEIKMLNDHGFNTDGLILVDYRAHVVTQQHIDEDNNDSVIGTTKQGIGPAYRNKYGRTGRRIGDLTEFSGNIFSVVDSIGHLDGARILAEGAQGFALDIDWGDYPFVTSSHCTVGSVCLNGVSPRKIRKIYGVAKAYETYVGIKDFGMDCPDLKKIQEIGQEFGATTGRPRKCNWIDLNKLAYAAKVNDITHLIVNKIDILDQVGKYVYIEDFERHDAGSRLGLINEIVNTLSDNVRVVFSDSPHTI
jgi:adenylosuccinate synthase